MQLVDSDGAGISVSFALLFFIPSLQTVSVTETGDAGKHFCSEAIISPFLIDAQDVAAREVCHCAGFHSLTRLV